MKIEMHSFYLDTNGNILFIYDRIEDDTLYFAKKLGVGGIFAIEDENNNLIQKLG